MSVGAVRAVALELPVPPANTARVFGLEPLRNALQVKRVAADAPDDGRAIPRIHDAGRAALEGKLADAAPAFIERSDAFLLSRALLADTSPSTSSPQVQRATACQWRMFTLRGMLLALLLPRRRRFLCGKLFLSYLLQKRCKSSHSCAGRAVGTRMMHHRLLIT